MRVDVAGRRWTVSDHSTYDNAEGYHVDEWECEATGTRSTQAYILRERGAEMRWYFTRPVPIAVVSLPGGAPFADVVGSLTTPPTTLVYREVAHTLDETKGYGRWGFFFASADAIADDEIRTLAFPGAASVDATNVAAGADMPQAVARAMRVGPNHTDELLYHIANAGPVAWDGPFERIDAGPLVSGAGPRLTVAEGFARWIRQPEGRRSLDALLACVPLARRGPARERILEWSHHAEVMFRERAGPARLRRVPAGSPPRQSPLPRQPLREGVEIEHVQLRRRGHTATLQRSLGPDVTVPLSFASWIAWRLPGDRRIGDLSRYPVRSKTSPRG